jgi:hypothetical protein
MTSSIYFINYFYNSNLLVSLLSYDSLLYSSLFFLNIIHNNVNNLYVKNLINFFIDIPHIYILERYIYYCSCYIFSFILQILLWNQYNHKMISYLLLLTAYPLLLNKIIHLKPIYDIVQYYYNQIVNIGKFIASYIIANLLNIICTEIINKPVNITPSEIIAMFYSINYDSLLDIGKILFISIIVYYIEYEQQNKFNTKIMSFLYNKKYILDLKDYYFKNDVYKNISNPKDKIEKIINTRRWDLCFHPRIFKLLIHISNQSKGNNLLKIIWSYITYYEYYIMKFLSLYGIVSFTKILNVPIYFPIILSVLIKLYESDNVIIDFGCRLLSLIYYNYNSNIIITCLISECFEMLFNKHSKKIILFGYDKYKYHYQIIYHYNQYIYNLLTSIPFFYYLSFNIDYKLICLLLLSNDNIVFLYYLSFGLISNYNIYHLICLGGLFHISYSIFEFKNGYFKIDKLNIDLVKSFITKNKNIENKELDNSIKIIDNFLIK